jgi:hypothetical protein
VKEIYDAMNPSPGERYYKLNLQNLKTGRQNTIEFRQHSSSVPPEKVLNWIRFCVSFVTNSIRCQSPSAMGKNRVLSEQLDLLSQYVIKDRYQGVAHARSRRSSGGGSLLQWLCEWWQLQYFDGQGSQCLPYSRRRAHHSVGFVTMI